MTYVDTSESTNFGRFIDMNQAPNHHQAALTTCYALLMDVTYLRAAPLPVGRTQLVRRAVQRGVSDIVMCRHGWHLVHGDMVGARRRLLCAIRGQTHN